MFGWSAAVAVLGKADITKISSADKQAIQSLDRCDMRGRAVKERVRMSGGPRLPAWSHCTRDRAEIHSIDVITAIGQLARQRRLRFVLTVNQTDFQRSLLESLDKPDQVRLISVGGIAG